jgi:hypothetical protein
MSYASLEGMENATQLLALAWGVLIFLGIMVYLRNFPELVGIEPSRHSTSPHFNIG